MSETLQTAGSGVDSAFVSYSHKDTEMVQQIVATIESLEGISVWFDHSLRGGENYFSVIANQIMQSRFFVFIVSDNSISSDWCLRELEFAASERKTIIAIWLDNISISPRVKLVIQNTHYINYYSASSEAFSHSVRRAFSGDPAPAVPAGSRRVERETEWDRRYFLEDAKLLKIKSLLASEKEGKFSLCFQSENANLLGIAYELGIHTKANPVLASLYYRASSHSGDLDGKYLYATLKYSACQDPEEKAAWYRQRLEAAEAGSLIALDYMGEDFYYGDNGCDEDRDRAYAFWKQGADRGSPYSLYSLAYGYRIGEGVPEDAELAYIYALKAVESGFPRAYRQLAFLYRDGSLFPKDDEKAIAMFDKAAAMGDYAAVIFKGNFFYSREDYATARRFYEEALQYAIDGKILSGLPFYRMGIIHEYGQGVEKNLEKAGEFYLKGAQRKHKNSLKYAVDPIREMENGPRKEALLLQAYEYGCRNAAYYLGMLEKERSGDDTMTEAAAAYFTKGAEDGDMECIIQLLHSTAIIFSNRKEDSRTEALKWYQMLFANADEAYLDHLRKHDALCVYYYGYAIELDYDPHVQQSDREFVQRYFIKSLEESPRFLAQIAGFVVDGYLFPQESGSGLPVDVHHAEEMLPIVEGYLPKLREYLSGEEKDAFAEKWNEGIDMLIKGYTQLSRCYSNGQNVQKNRQKAADYKEKAARLSRQRQK